MSPKKIVIATTAFMVVCGTVGAQEMRGARSMYPGSTDQGAMCRMDEHIDGQLGYIKAELKITEAQTPQWNIFADAFRADKEKQALACKAMREQTHATASTALPESMKMMADRLTVRLESLRIMEASIGPLYASLSKEQKRKADDILKGAPGL